MRLKQPGTAVSFFVTRLTCLFLVLGAYVWVFDPDFSHRHIRIQSLKTADGTYIQTKGPLLKNEREDYPHDNNSAEQVKRHQRLDRKEAAEERRAQKKEVHHPHIAQPTRPL